MLLKYHYDILRPNISSHSKLHVHSFLICQCKEKIRTKRNLCNLKWSHNRYFKIINLKMKPSYKLKILYVPFIRYGFIEQSSQKHSKKAKKRQKSNINGALSVLVLCEGDRLHGLLYPMGIRENINLHLLPTTSTVYLIVSRLR